MIEEIWKPIKGNEKYLVSNFGRIKSLYTNRFLKPCILDGYYRVVLRKKCKERKQEIKNIHRLVAENFIENKFNYPCVNHKDENKLNNYFENLEWCSYRYNNIYKDRHKKAGEKLRGKEPWNKGKMGS